MNRIIKYLDESQAQGGRNWSIEVVPDNPAERRAVTDAPRDVPELCSFCGKPARLGKFTAYGMKQQQAALCSNCIEVFAVLNQFAKVLRIYMQPAQNYQALKNEILNSFALDTAPAAAKTALADLCIRLVQRASAVVHGCRYSRCPRTGVPLALPRAALMGGAAPVCARLLARASLVTGMPVLVSNARDLRSGLAYEKLKEEKANGEKAWAEHAVLFCADGYVAVDPRCVVVYACRHGIGIPPWVERIQTE